MKHFVLSTTLVVLFFTPTLRAQDKHLTQFYAAPLTLNPALTGVFEGKYRVGINYRDQWRSVLENPIRTFAIGGDFRFKSPVRQVKRDAFGLGLLFFNDKVGIVDFSTTQIALSSAYHKALDVNGRQFLSLGLQGGLAQRNINYASLNFHDEFDGVNGYTLGTLETLPENNFSFADFNVGLNYSLKFDRNGGLFLGAALHHLLEPRISFFKTREGDGRRLFRKYNVQAAANVPLQRGVVLSPRFLLANQGPHLEINTGANIRFTVSEYGSTAVHLGSWVRPVRNTDGVGVDALILLAGIELGNVVCGMSYDLNIGAITKTRTRQGAFEVSLTYLGEYENEEILCPKF